MFYDGKVFYKYHHHRELFAFVREQHERNEKGIVDESVLKGLLRNGGDNGNNLNSSDEDEEGSTEEEVDDDE